MSVCASEVWKAINRYGSLNSSCGVPEWDTDISFIRRVTNIMACNIMACSFLARSSSILVFVPVGEGERLGERLVHVEVLPLFRGGSRGDLQ